MQWAAFGAWLALGCAPSGDVATMDAPVLPVHATDPFATPGDEAWRRCATVRCRGGSFIVDTAERGRGGDTYEGYFRELVPCSPHHPNGCRDGA